LLLFNKNCLNTTLSDQSKSLKKCDPLVRRPKAAVNFADKIIEEFLRD